ncbi:hypothetical protein ACX1N5_09330 [Acinetobacter sp. ANC 4636]
MPKNLTTEHELAMEAARILHEKFIEAASSGKVLYVENDIVWSKTPNNEPVLIKYLSGRDPNLTKKFANQKTFKIKKRNIDTTEK